MLSEKLLPVAKAPPTTYIEDVFSTYLYTGNGSDQTINNGIDLAGKGGMVWLKRRDTAANNLLFDTSRVISGGYPSLYSNTTNGNGASLAGYDFSSFNSNGFTFGPNYGYPVNASGGTYASWTFRNAPKFFDVVTYTGNGVAGRQISHSLGQSPGMMIVKCTSTSTNWAVWQEANGTPLSGYLNATSALFSGDPGNWWNNTAPTSTSFTVGDHVNTNASGSTYVAYLFAHDTTADGLIQCGSYTGNGSTTGPNITLGWEAQYVLIKNATDTGDWTVWDTMRGMPIGSAGDNFLSPNNTNVESAGWDAIAPTATGFALTGFDANNTAWNRSGNTYIYMAIRRGPMKTPTDATKVFTPTAYSGNNSSNTVLEAGHIPDMIMSRPRATTSAYGFVNASRLAGNQQQLATATTGSETTDYGPYFSFYPAVSVTNLNNAIRLGNGAGGAWQNSSGATYIDYAFKRAPGFFDEVCYTGTGSARTVNHNLGVAPELMIVKGRSGTSAVDYWAVYSSSVGNTKALLLNDTSGSLTSTRYWNDTSPTSTVFTVGDSPRTGGVTTNYVAYLFASCPGVSKVGSYTGTGATQTISCGFTGGARFVLIKRTDSTGDWWVWDTARGMVSGTDPRLATDTTNAEINANWCYTTTGGFQLVTTDASVNASGGSYIYLAVA